jgi:mono/diheme cytochrome c family protein
MRRLQICLGLMIVGAALAEDAPAGLRLKLSAGGQSAVSVVPNVHLFVPSGASASPLLPPGKTDAEWIGYINADLRGDFRFKADSNGTLKVAVNGEVILEGDTSKASREVRLNKGPNELKVSFKSPPNGNAFVRLLWSEYGFLWEPIHRSHLTRDSDDGILAKTKAVLHGRELFLEGRCAKCHTASRQQGIPELEMDAPSFDGVGSRRHAAWMAKWILNPKGERQTAQMPVMLHGPQAAESAEAMAAYLGSLKNADQGLTGKPDEESEGEYLVELFHCIGCHTLPGSGETDPQRISLALVNEKFPPGHLAAFLLEPTKHYQWRRMPNFGMSKVEAVTVAAYLRNKAPMVKAKAPDPKLIGRGRELVQATGCLNCHALDGGGNRFEAKKFAEVKKSGHGCVAESAGGRAPFYGFTEDERADLMAFAASDLKSLQRHVPAEFAERQARNLQCTACHGQLEGFPPLERLGGKLKPEFMAELIGGKLDYSPRPWLEKVMPSFPVYANGLAAGLGHSHGYSHETPKEKPIDAAAAKVGQKLTGVNGGFSCISCHGVGEMQPTQVFEAEGINLSLPARRLQKDYFIRWVLNPLKIESQSKMPVYFDEEGNSPLFDVYEGNTMKQLEAFWQYMRMGDKIAPPKMDGF